MQCGESITSITVKHLYLPTRLHAVVTQKTTLRISITVKTSCNKGIIFYCQVCHMKNENTPPHGRKTPRRKVLQNEGLCSPRQASHICVTHNAIKKKLFSAGSAKFPSNIHSEGPKFQTLAPQTPSGPSFIRVQNSQVQLIYIWLPLSVGLEFVSCHKDQLECIVDLRQHCTLCLITLLAFV